MSNFRSRFRRQALLIGGPSDGKRVPIGPETLPWPGFICTGAAGPKPRTWHHYVYVGEGLYEHVGPCSEIDHQGRDPHDHCDHQWDDESGLGHGCEQVYGHDGDHVCGCCRAIGDAQ